MNVPAPEPSGTPGRIGPAATPRGWWHAWRPRVRVSLRLLLLGIALLGIVLAAGAHALKTRWMRQRAAVSLALFQPLVQHHAYEAERYRDHELLCKRLMYGQIRGFVDHGLMLVRLLGWGLKRVGSDPEGARSFFESALNHPLRMKQDLHYLAFNSDHAALQDRKASYHDREAAYYARLLREGRTEEGRRPLDLEVERLTLEAAEHRFDQKHGSTLSEVVAWNGRMAAYYDREAAHWARLWREGRTAEGPGPAELEAQRRFVEAENKALYKIHERVPRDPRVRSDPRGRSI